MPASGPVIAVSQSSLSLTFMLQDGYLIEVSTLGECSIYTDFAGTFIVSLLHFVICQPGGVVLSSTQEFAVCCANTEMAGKATAGAPTCEKGDNDLQQTTLSTHQVQQGVEKECDRRCK